MIISNLSEANDTSQLTYEIPNTYQNKICAFFYFLVEILCSIIVVIDFKQINFNGTIKISSNGTVKIIVSKEKDFKTKANGNSYDIFTLQKSLLNTTQNNMEM